MKGILLRIDGALAGRYAAAELETVKKALCLEHLGISAVSFFTKEQLAPDAERDGKLDAALQRLAAGEPLQYIIGYTPFCGLQFSVDGRVLIPRPETAELVEWVASENARAASILDIGTGSGCIAVTLAHKLPGCKVQGWDISDGALEVARENNRRNGTSARFRKVDILSAPSVDCRFDVIVSNPPYVLESEKARMEDTVLAFEPHTALFVPDNDALLFYRAIAEFGKTSLTPGSRLYFEINPLKAQDMELMLSAAGYHNVELRSDIFGKLRFIKAIL